MDADRLRAPTPGALGAIGVLALLAAGMVIALRLTSEFPGDEPGLQAGLLDWIVLSYVFSGLVAWRRRPESRFGPLMILAGFATSLSSLSSASGALPFTVGQAMDLVPFAVFFHVYLSFPSGRLPGRPERWVVGAAYFVAVALELVGLALGGFRPDNVLAIVDEPDLAMTLLDFQLVTLAALALASIVVLAYRRRQSGPPRRRSAALLVDSFAIALAMCSALLVMGAFFLGEAFLAVQRTTFFVLGLAPVAFLIALLDARLARSSVADLLVELRSDPTPQELREPIARVLNDPSLELAYWLPQFGSWADSEGRAVRLPQAGDGRATTLIDRDGEHLAALVHHPSLEQERELLEAVSAAAAIALENGRLHAELKARLEELQGSRTRVIEAGQEERKRLERNLHDGAQQRLIALSLELGLLGKKIGDDPEATARIERARSEIATSLEELRTVARGLHPAVHARCSDDEPVSSETDLGRDERQVLRAGGSSKFVVPTGEPGVVGLSHHQRGRELHGVVRTQHMLSGQVSRAPYELCRDVRDHNAAPEPVELRPLRPVSRASEAFTGAHPRERRMRLHICDFGYGNRRGSPQRTLHIRGAGLLDEQLDQRAGIEKQDQRRPSLT